LFFEESKIFIFVIVYAVRLKLNKKVAGAIGVALISLGIVAFFLNKGWRISPLGEANAYFC
jgi:hypothetical protein